jgi:hypothetical protein
VYSSPHKTKNVQWKPFYSYMLLNIEKCTSFHVSIINKCKPPSINWFNAYKIYLVFISTLYTQILYTNVFYMLCPAFYDIFSNSNLPNENLYIGRFFFKEIKNDHWIIFEYNT